MATTTKTTAPTKKAVWEDEPGWTSKQDVVQPFGGAGSPHQGRPNDLNEAAMRAMRPGMGPRKAGAQDDFKSKKRSPAIGLPNAKPIESKGQLTRTLGTRAVARETKKVRPNARGKRNMTTFSPQTIERRLNVSRGKR